MSIANDPFGVFTTFPSTETFSVTPIIESDALRVRLLAAFDLSDRRGNELLVAYAELHAKRYPKEPA